MSVGVGREQKPASRSMPIAQKLWTESRMSSVRSTGNVMQGKSPKRQQSA